MQVNISSTIKKIGIHIAFLSVFSMQVVAQMLPAPEYSGPVVEPDYPVGFKDMDLSIMSADISPAPGAPRIAEWTRINKPGDSMMVVGHQLSARTGDEYGRDTSFHFFPSRTNQLADSLADGLVDGLVRRLENDKTTITLPDKYYLPENSMYLMWPRNINGYGRPVSINQAEAWWAAPRSVAVGDTFSVFGRNLVVNEATPISYLYIQNSGGSGRWIRSVSANPYKVEFEVPKELINGKYTIWAHNGSGKRAGWSEPIQVTIRTKHGWSDDRSTWINVKTDHGAVGDGSANDYKAIANALVEAKSGSYETVYFPAGTYAISEKINVYGDMRIIGDGMDQTKITTHSSYGHGKNAYGLFMMGGNKGQTEFHDMTFSSGKYLTQGIIDKIAQYRGAENMLFKNIRFDYLEHDQSKNSEVINIDRSKNIIFDSCDFILTGALSLAYASEIIIKECNFYGINDIGYMISASSARKVSVEDCTAQHYDSSDLNDGHGWSQGRFLNGSGSNGGIHDVYFGGNQCNDMMVRPGYYNQNTGEKFMTEHGHTVFRDKPSAFSATSVTLSALSEDFTGETVVVVGGKGLGQSREIVAFSNGKITVDRPWLVIPDRKSIIMVGEYMNRHVVYNNYFDGIMRATESDGTATTGVEPFGAQLNMIVDNNMFHELRKGISNWSMPSPVQGNQVSMQPNYFNMFINNRFDKCRYGIENAIAIWNYKPTVWDTTMLGNIYRGNDIQNTVKEAIRYFVWQSDDTRIDMCVFDQNKASNIGNSVTDGEDLKNQVWIGNEFYGINSGSAITFSGDHMPVLYGNTWNGFSSSKYGGSRPGGILEVPYRSVLVGSSDTPLKFPILNSGTDALSWSATSSQPWLKLDSASGSISDENDSDKLVMSIDETETSFALAPPAIITIVSGDQVKQMTVTYSEGAVPPPPENPPEPILTSIRIEGADLLDEETAESYICIGSYSDGTSEIISGQWALSSAYATINEQGVLLAGDITNDQIVTISITVEKYTVSKVVELKFVPPVISIIVVNGPSSVSEGISAQYTSFAHYSDGTVLSVNPVWSTSTGGASIDSRGKLTVGNVSGDQQITVTASFGGKEGAYVVNIKYLPPTLSGITIVGSLVVSEESSQQYDCVGSYSDGTTAVVSPLWSENSAYASISTSGLLKVGDISVNQVVIISATIGGYTANQTISIQYAAPNIAFIELSGPSVVTEETSAQYTCEAVYSDGSRASVKPAWSIVSPYASVNNSGWLQAGDVADNQTVVLVADYAGLTSSFSVEVRYLASADVMTGLSIAAPAHVNENGIVMLRCDAIYSDGSVSEVEPTWSVIGSAIVDAAGGLTLKNVNEDEVLTVTATYLGLKTSVNIDLWSIGNRIIYPLTGFEGKIIRSRIFDEKFQEWYDLGEMEAPKELFIENIAPDQWYWISIEEYDVERDYWEVIHEKWISM